MKIVVSGYVSSNYIENITWPRGDTKFLFECWKIFHKWAQRTSEIFFQHEKKNFLSPSGHVMFYLLYKHHFTLIVFWCERRDLLCIHSKGDILTREDNMLFSHVKISGFRAKAHLIFHWCLYNKFLLLIVSLSCNFNRYAICFQSFSEHRLQEYGSKCRAYHTLLKITRR